MTFHVRWRLAPAVLALRQPGAVSQVSYRRGDRYVAVVDCRRSGGDDPGGGDLAPIPAHQARCFKAHRRMRASTPCLPPSPTGSSIVSFRRASDVVLSKRQLRLTIDGAEHPRLQPGAQHSGARHLHANFLVVDTRLSGGLALPSRPRLIRGRATNWSSSPHEVKGFSGEWSLIDDWGTADLPRLITYVYGILHVDGYRKIRRRGNFAAMPSSWSPRSCEVDGGAASALRDPHAPADSPRTRP